MMNQQYYIYSRILPVLISTCCIEFNSTRREFTLFQYYKTLSSIITSFCIIFNICYMMNQQYYIYSRIFQVLFQHAALNLITTKREFTLLQYSTTLSTGITSFCIIIDICYMMNQQYYIYSRILPALISTWCNQFNHYKTRIYCITIFYRSLKRNHIILYHIWYLLHDEPTVLYIFQNIPSIDFNWIYAVFYNTLKRNHIIEFNTPSIDFNMLHWI